MSCASTGPISQTELPPMVAGNTWDGIPQIGPIRFNEPAPPSNLVKIEMSFRMAATDINPAYVISTVAGPGIGTAVIDDAALWTGHIPPQALPLAAGIWRWNLRFTAADGTIFTPVGGTIAIAQAI